MPSPSPPPDRAGVIARLRAAGCVFAEDEAQLLTEAGRSPTELAAMVDRRSAGEPLEQILGWAEFCGLRIALEPGVFVPRRRTEFLVHQVVRPDGPARTHPRPVVVDLCCGSGAVGAALSAALAGVQLYAADLDPAAVRCARRNLEGSGGHVYEGDLYDPLPTTLWGRVDILVANVPYVPTNAIALMPPEAREHEPRVALDGGPDGLDVARRVIAQARQWLAPGGHVLVETSEGQAADLAASVAEHGLTAQVASSAELGATVIIGTRPAPDAPAPGRNTDGHAEG